MGEKITVVKEYEKEDGTVIVEHRRRTAKEKRSKFKQLLDRVIK